MWFVYILECSRGKLYTGVTSNLKRRFTEHMNRKVRFTCNNLPVKIVFTESFLSKSQALKREAQIKKWTRKKKLALIKNDLKLLKQL